MSKNVPAPFCMPLCCAVFSKSVTNWTLNDRKRGVEIDVSVGREAEPEDVIRLLQAAAAGIEGISARPAPQAWLNALGS